MKLSKRKIRRFLVATLWFGFGVGLLIFLLAAIRKRDDKVCKGLNVAIVNQGTHLFADKSDIRGMIKYMNVPVEGAPVSEIDLRAMEAELEKNAWIKNAELFFDNNEVLQVRVTEREPIARIFTNAGRSYYIDEELVRLPLSSRFSARVPVFTGCPLDKTKWNGEDSTVLLQIKRVSDFVSNHEFWMAQVAQVDYAAANRFEIIPTVGDHKVVLGEAADLETKFNKLYIFYKEVLAKTGWNQYATIDIRFKEQVVAIKNEPKKL